MKKQSCIIAGTILEEGLCLLKNRDRAYDPELQVVRLEIAGTEVAVVFDLTTGYMEGVNEHGIGIVNTALMVARDEQEGKGPDKGKKPAKSEDGIRILKALSCSTLQDAVQSILSFRKGVKGHTFVSDGKDLYSIEASRTHKGKVLKLDPSRVNTRTNHGVWYPDSGYTEGDDYVSSVVRRWETQKRLQEVSSMVQLAPTLRKPIHDAESNFNPVRDTEKMRTTNQTVMKLGENPQLLLYLIPKHSEFHGIRNLLPEEREPTIDVRVLRYKK